jgi:hypothetical protein
VHGPEVGEPLPERRGVAVAFGDVAQVDEELDGRVVLARLLRGDESADPLPRGRLVDRESIEMPLPGDRRVPFPQDPVVFALSGVAAFPLAPEICGGGEQFPGGAWGRRGRRVRRVLVAVSAYQLAA